MAKRKETNKIIIHCADTPASMDIGAKEIEVWHRQRGFLEIGYHYVIRRDGTLETGRALDDIGAHAVNHNKDSIGICLVGGRAPYKQGDIPKPEDNFTPAQFVQLKNLIGELKAAYPSINSIIGHSAVDRGKYCPSFAYAQWLKDNKL